MVFSHDFYNRHDNNLKHMKKIKVNNMSKNYIISCLFVDLIDLVKKKIQGLRGRTKNGNAREKMKRKEEEIGY